MIGKIDLKSIPVGSVWMTASGYPAIISDVVSAKVFGLVISPSGPVFSSWNENGKNQSNLAEFYDLKFPPELLSHSHVIIKNGVLIGTAPEFESAKRTAFLNDAELVSKLSDLKIEMFEQR